MLSSNVTVAHLLFMVWISVHAGQAGKVTVVMQSFIFSISSMIEQQIKEASLLRFLCVGGSARHASAFNVTLCSLISVSDEII